LGGGMDKGRQEHKQNVHRSWTPGWRPRTNRTPFLNPGLPPGVRKPPATITMGRASLEA
jgi:hypothetical protein